jgi:hypothetical protein
MKNAIAKFGMPVMAVVLAGSVHGQVVNMQLANTTYSEDGFTATLSTGGVGQIIASDDLIGLYGFSVNSVTPGSPLGSLSLGSTFYSTCISPLGVLDNAPTPYNYQVTTFASASPGTYPSAWVSPAGAPNAGIQNADYIFSLLAPTLYGGHLIAGQSGSAQDQAAALAMTMYASLYNSTGYGAAGSPLSPSSAFSITADAYGSTETNAIDNDIKADLTDLGGLASVNPANLPAGYVLVPTPADEEGPAGQSMLLGVGVPGGYPVPEPSTVIAGASLLVPLGASTLRILRKNRVA